jgi:hypothetical protein
MSSTGFVRQVFVWLHQVNGDHKLPASAAKVAIYLSSMFNEEENGAAWPATETISKAIGKVRSVVTDALRQLEARGHLSAEWGKQGQGHYGHYWMIIKPQEAKVSETMKRRPTDISEARETSVLTPQNVGFDPPETSASRHDSSTYSSKKPSNSSNSAGRDEDSGKKKKEGETTKGRSNSVNGAETDLERLRRWWAMVGDWVQHDESGWPFREWGPRPGDINCQIPDSVLMEWLISLESPRTPWHVKNALRSLEQSYVSACEAENKAAEEASP